MENLCLMGNISSVFIKPQRPNNFLISGNYVDREYSQDPIRRLRDLPEPIFKKRYQSQQVKIRIPQPKSVML